MSQSRSGRAGVRRAGVGAEIGVRQKRPSLALMPRQVQKNPKS